MKTTEINIAINSLIDDLRKEYTSSPSADAEALKFLFRIFEKVYNFFDLTFGRDYVVAQINFENLSWIKELKSKAYTICPLQPHAVFEDGGEIKEIVADVWKDDNADSNPSNGIINMLFSSNCSKLPIHVHPQSERVMIILRGHGQGHYSLDDLENADLSNVKSLEVNEGSIIFFRKNTLHTFSTKQDALETLTYHVPFLEFNDEISFEKFKNWYPEAATVLNQ